MKNAKAIDTSEFKATKAFAVGLVGSNPLAQNVTPAWPKSHRTHNPIPINEVARTYLLSKLKMTEITKLTAMQLTIGK